LLNWSS